MYIYICRERERETYIHPALGNCGGLCQPLPSSLADSLPQDAVQSESMYM